MVNLLLGNLPPLRCLAGLLGFSLLRVITQPSLFYQKQYNQLGARDPKKGTSVGPGKRYMAASLGLALELMICTAPNLRGCQPI